MVNGLATYGFLIVARRTLGDDAYGGLAVLWSLVYIGGPGLFQPLEQEVARATAAQASRGAGAAAVLRKASVIGAGGFAVIAAGILIAWPLGLNGLLDHKIELLGSLVLALAAFAGAELVRGVLSGRHLFERYGLYFATEGGVRLIVAVVLALVGVAVVGAFGVALAAAFALAALAGIREIELFGDPGPSVEYRDLTPALGWLLVASLGEAFILNVGPVALDIVAPEDFGADAPGVFLNAMIIARVPLFFFQAVKVSLLPSLASCVGRNDLAEFRRRQLRLITAVAAVSLVGVAVAAGLGPWLVRVVFGDTIGRLDMILLAAGSGGLMVMLSLSLGLVALGHTRLAVTGWVAAVIVFAVVIQFGADPFLRVEMSLLAAVLAGSAVVGALLAVEYAAHRAAPAGVSEPGPSGVQGR